MFTRASAAATNDDAADGRLKAFDVPAGQIPVLNNARRLFLPLGWW